jgi:ABC-type cobalamin/Fe3+-siderophores transport system ATPase subunit
VSSEETNPSPQQPELYKQAGDYAIAITNCNSITEAEITLRRDSLNIKYGPNGIGKSTIARASVLNACARTRAQRKGR